MENKKALEYFQHLSINQSINQSKMGVFNDYTQMDADFILKYTCPQSKVLDLGSGTGLIINKLYDKVGFICAVEPFEKFTEHIVKSSNVAIHNKTLLDFESNELFDLITIFGVMHYFNGDEAAEMYQKYYPLLKSGGKIVVKNQFGVHEDVTVDGYSEEQKRNYFASYRYIKSEEKLLEQAGFKNIKTFDIYPPECNRWDNTHFYAIVAEK